MANPPVRMLPTPGYVQYQKNLSVPPDIVGARAGYRPGFGFYVKIPGMPMPPGTRKRRAGGGGGGGGAGVGAGLDPLTQLTAMQLKSLMSPGAMQTSAQQQALDAIKLQTDAITQANAAQKAELERRSERASGFATALANITQPQADQIGGLYRGAAEQLRGYGTGLTGEVAAAENADIERTNQQISATLGGLGTGTQSASPEAIQNAAQMAGVTIPGTNMVKDAVDAVKQSMYDRAAHAQAIQDISTGFDQQETDLDKQIAAKKMEIAATAPELRRSALQDLQTLQNQKIATIMQGIGLQNTIGDSTSERAYRKALAAAAKKKAKAPAHAYQHTTVGKHPVTFDPNTGTYTDPSTGAAIPNATIQKWLKEAATSSGGGKPKSWQNTTYNGIPVLFDPGPPGQYYLPGDTTHPLSLDELKKLKDTSAADIRTARAQAATGVQDGLKQKKGPKEIYTLLVAQKVPGWIALRALVAEAANHKGDKVWDTLAANPGAWVRGT